MSRIGKKPMTLPKGVTVTLKSDRVSAKGPKGELSMAVAEGTSFAQEGGAVVVSRNSDSPKVRANHGLMRSLLANLVEGVSKGYERELEIVGVGYKAEVKGATLVMNLGYSHPVEYPFPKGITISVDKGNRIKVMGADKQLVGHVAAELRGKRPPDSYKGKGVRYAGEHVRLKAGKAGQ